MTTEVKVKSRKVAAVESSSNTSSINDDMAFQMNKNVTELVKKISGFETTFQSCKEFAEGYLKNFDDQVNFKKRKVDEITENFKLHQHQKEIELRNHIDEKGYQYTLEILASRQPKEIAIQERAHLELVAELIKVKADMAEQVKTEITKHKELLEREYKYKEETSKLKQASESAAQKAELGARDSHIKVLQESLANAKDEINKQRDLTMQISNSFSNANKTTVVSNDQFSSSNANRR